jgi:GNAT superfamily N-acetyltransferase
VTDTVEQKTEKLRAYAEQSWPAYRSNLNHHVGTKMEGSPTMTFWVKDDREQEVGTMLIVPVSNDLWEVYDIQVRLEDRRKGHGTRMLKDLAEFADANGVALTGQVLPGGREISSEGLHAFVREQGFVYEHENDAVRAHFESNPTGLKQLAGCPVAYRIPQEPAPTLKI